jgi:prepilin-type N-terminal cleavage/methylation domain-containing protein/prepilin-type processing-associated H-X9-DG protein
MSITRLPDEFVESLLAQDNFFTSPELAQHRRKVIDSLMKARKQEKIARRSTATICGACLLIAAAIFAGAALEIIHVSALPEWMPIVLALVVILSAVTAVLILGLYFLRYRLTLALARKTAQEQAVLDIPRQINQLRDELQQLRKQPANEEKRPNDSKAFTLLELLAVIAILAVLGSLLLPALAGAKARSRIAACKNNLRQMGKGLAMYEADFRYFPGAGNDANRINQPPWLEISPESWRSKMCAYVGTNNPIFSCPDYELPAPASSDYGYNAAGGCAINYPPYTLGLGLGDGFGFIKSNQVLAPDDMIALGDLQLPSNVFRFVISPWHKRPLGNLDSVIPTRHSGSSVMAFLDCHVEWSKRPGWIAETAKARMRWNNDHQPHPETW